MGYISQRKVLFMRILTFDEFPDKGMIQAKAQEKGVLDGQPFIRTCLLIPYDEIGNEIVIYGILILIEHPCGYMHSAILQYEKGGVYFLDRNIDISFNGLKNLFPVQKPFKFRQQLIFLLG